MIKIREVEVDFDFLDADDIEKFENEAEKLKSKSEEYKNKEMKLSELLKAECQIIKDFFDNVFGEGISLKVFGEKNNLQDCISAFEEIVNEKIKQQKSIENTFARYTPNREQKRKKK